MEFPVDVLEATSHGELEHSAHSYMNELLYIDPDHAHYFTLPSGKKVQISLSSVGFVPLYGANLQHKVLALFTPQDQLTAVALFLANQWYSMEDSLKTANSRREGLIKVRSVGERIVLYVLNRIVYRTNEMGSGEMPFLCHNENDYAKILWKNGQAVGFYSVKPKGSVCNNYLKQCYFLPVLDSIFVRKVHRGKGYGLQMLEDFVDSFSEDELGLKYPLSPAMTKVCRHYLDRYPADVDLFWEVESVGGPYQRTRVAYKLSSTPLNDTRKGGHAEDDGQNRVILEDQVEDAEETSLNITEEVIVVNKLHKITKELETPISTRTQSSEHRRRKRVRDEDEAKSVDSRPDKIHRLEMPEEEEEEKADEPESEAHTETPAGADEDNTSASQNNTGVEEIEEMEVKEVAEEYQAVVQKDASQTVDTLKEPAAEQQGVALAAEDNQKIEINSLVYLQQKKENAPAAEEEKAAENEQKVDAPEAKKQNVAPAAEEKQEIVNGAEKVAAPLSNEKQEAPKITEEVVAPVSEEKQEGASSVKKEEEVALAAKEMQEEAPAAKDKSAVTVKEQEDAPSVEEVQEVALEVVNEVDPATEKEEEVASDSDVDPDVEKQEVGPPASETTSSLTTDSEGEQGQEEAMDFINDMGVTGISEQSSQEKEEHLSVENEYNTLTVEEEEAAQKEDETEEEEENVNEASDISQGPPEVRTKAVPPSSKRTSKRLSKMTLEDGEVEQEKVIGIEKEEKKVMKEEETEHSSEEEEQVQDLPVTDKRVLRGKPKVIQTMQRPRGKRRGKM